MTRARGYIVLESVFRLTADIVRGMARFEPTVLLSQPIEQVLFYYTFQLRGCISETSESVYWDEYLEFVDHFRNNNASFKELPHLIVKVVDLLSSIRALRSSPGRIYFTSSS